MVSGTALGLLYLVAGSCIQNMCNEQKNARSQSELRSVEHVVT